MPSARTPIERGLSGEALRPTLLEYEVILGEIPRAGANSFSRRDRKNPPSRSSRSGRRFPQFLPPSPPLCKQFKPSRDLQR